jgi:hypothetical protein
MNKADYLKWANFSASYHKKNKKTTENKQNPNASKEGQNISDRVGEFVCISDRKSLIFLTYKKLPGIKETTPKANGRTVHTYAKHDP